MVSVRPVKCKVLKEPEEGSMERAGKLPGGGNMHVSTDLKDKIDVGG